MGKNMQEFLSKCLVFAENPENSDKESTGLMMVNKSIKNYMVSYEGWFMALIGFICMFSVFASPAVILPLIYGEVMDEFGWTRSEATMVFTYKNIFTAVVSLFLIGPIVQRFGLRVVIVGSCITVGVGMLAFLFVNSLTTYYIVGSIMGIGMGGVFVGVGIFISRWFYRNQGLALGIVLSGTSIGGFIFPIITAALIDAFGWRVAVAGISLGIWFIALPLYLWKAKENPSELDILPEAANTSSDFELIEKIKAADLGHELYDLLRHPMFWLASASIFLVAVVDFGMLQHTMLYVERDLGLDRKLAVFSLSAIFAVSLAGKLCAGWFYDRTSIMGIRIWYLFMSATVLLALSVQGVLSLAVFAIARGIAHGGFVSEMMIMAKHCFGPRLMNQVGPIFYGFFVIGAAVGPMILSIMYDHFGGYTEGFVLFAGLGALAAGLLLWVRPMYRERLIAIESRVG